VRQSLDNEGFSNLNQSCNPLTMAIAERNLFPPEGSSKTAKLVGYIESGKIFQAQIWLDLTISQPETPLCEGMSRPG
jgi:hypothetical protein